MATRVIAYEVEVRGIKGTIQNQDDLTAAVKATTAAYKQADFGTDEFKAAEKELANLRTLQGKFRQDVKDTAREQQIAADKGKGSYRALNAELVNLRRRFKELSREERDAFGPQILGRINAIDKELKDIDASMGQYQRNVGNYADALSGIGGVDLVGLATIPGAIAAAGAAAVDAGRFVAELTERFRRLRGEVQNLTGETGEALDGLTARVASIADTFQESETEILNAANAVAQQLGIPFDEAFDRIEEGFIAGSNQTGEFLDNLREYPAFFAEANLGADALFRTINKQATQGLFSDKGVDTIKEATIRLRELPTATRDALRVIGIEAEEITDLIGQEGIGSAIAFVSQRLGELQADSPEVGQALADIFGGPGEDAGIAFVTSIKDIITETGTLIDASNEYQLQQQRALEVNRQFAEIQVEVANALGGSGASFDNLGTIIKTKALEVLLFFIERAQSMFEATAPLREALTEVARNFGLIGNEGTLVDAIMFGISKTVEFSEKAFRAFVGVVTFVVDRFNDLVGAGRSVLEFFNILSDEEEKATESASRMAGAHGRLGGSVGKTSEESKKAVEALEQLRKKTADVSKATKTAAVATDAYAEGSIAKLRDEVNKLKKDLDTIAPEGQQGVLEKLLGAEAALEAAENARIEIRNKLIRAKDEIQPIPLLPTNEELEARRGVIFEREIEFRKDLAEGILEQEVDLAAAQAEIRQTLFDSLATVTQALSEGTQIRYANEISALEERYETEIELAEGNEDRQEELREELAKKREQIQKREFAAQKRFRVASALSSLAEGIINILAAPTVIPDPFGAIFKGIRVGVLTGTTALQIANIQKQQAARGKLLPIQQNTVRFLASGDIIDGVFRGAAHSDPSGGIATIINGQPLVVEDRERIDRDEFGALAVINKRSSAVFGSQLKAMQGVTFPGKRSVLSGINSYRNYGIPFAADGALVQPDISGLIGTGAIGAGRVEVILSDGSIALLADRTGESVAKGAMVGVGAGLDTANRRREREEILNEKTGV